MLNIDGSIGEGGGQVVRNTLALSALTGIPVTITRIRARRKNPGLAAQHIAAVRAVASACNAECRGAAPGSATLEFIPHEPECCHVSVAVGTAGSIPLVIQAWLPVALHAGGTLHVTGGTEIHMSPTIDYLDHVFAAVLRSSGADIRIRILKRGYFPEGGGDVEVTVQQKTISPVIPGTVPDRSCHIYSCSSNLPEHVAERQAAAAAAAVGSEIGGACTIHLDRRTGLSTGSSCTVVKGPKGGTALGRRGLPAEEVGKMAARALLSETSATGTVDSHLSDQLLLPLALYGGSFSTHALTSHAETTCRLLEKFGYEISVRGAAPVEFTA
jgi:RNA 3'-terminal phosphate cyclase (ATP)